MTLERILLQTIKFDLMVEHPYAYLLKFAKLIKGTHHIYVSRCRITSRWSLVLSGRRCGKRGKVWNGNKSLYC